MNEKKKSLLFTFHQRLPCGNDYFHNHHQLYKRILFEKIKLVC